MELTLSPTEAVPVIISQWFSAFRKQYGGQFPDDYTCFDTETTGFSRKEDLVIEWGHCRVRGRKPGKRVNVLINWFGSGLVPDDWLSAQLRRVARRMRINTGHKTHINEEKMRKNGIPVHEALPRIHEMVTTLAKNGEMFVSHNGWNFDVEMLQAHFKDFIDDPFMFPEDQMFDTGAIEKASQLADDPRILPQPGETMKVYFKRITHWKAPGVKWNLDTHCMEKYNLAEKYGLDPGQTHRAGFDAYLLHLLMEEFRALLNEPAPTQGLEPRMPVVKDAPKKRVNKKRVGPTTQKGIVTTGKKRRRGQRNR
jgi:DNA polymerase III epsilon subunit-like protein